MQLSLQLAAPLQQYRTMPAMLTMVMTMITPSHIPRPETPTHKPAQARHHSTIHYTFPPLWSQQQLQRHSWAGVALASDRGWLWPRYT